MRRLASFLAKAAISALLLYLSVHLVNFGSVGERLGTLNFGWLVFMLRPKTAARAAVAGDCRDLWRSVASHSRTQLQFNRLVFSQVLPCTIGGDAARIWLMARGGAG
jgi:hypothetical protein